MTESFLDIKRLQRADEASRKEIAHKVGLFLSGMHKREDLELAMDFARILVEDASIAVRKKLAEELIKARDLPLEIKKAIAADIDSISIPFVIAARSLDDEFLQELLESGKKELGEAIACRDIVGERIAAIIVDTGTETAVSKLMENKGAKLTEGACDNVVQRFPTNRSIMEAMARRGDLPLLVAEKIIFKVAQEYGEMLLEKFDLEESYTRYLASVIGRRSLMESLDEASETEQRNYLQQLADSDGIHPETLRSFLEDGHVRMFIVALSLLVRRPAEVVEQMLEKRGQPALAKLLEIAGFTKASTGVLLISWSRHSSAKASA